MGIRSRAIRIRTFVLLAASLALFASPAIAQPAFELELLTPAELRVAPGHSVEHGLRIRNVGDSAGPLRLLGGLSLVNRFSQWPYRFGAASNPRCGSMPVSIGDSIDLTTDSLAPGETLDCRWMVHRPPQATFDIHLVWTTGSTPATSTGLIFLGTLTDTVVSTRTRSFHVDAEGIGRATIELSIRNQGERTLGPQNAGNCYAGAGAVWVEDSIEPGGCGEAIWAPACFTGGGFGFALPEIEPGQDYRCTFHARTHLPYTAPAGYDIYLPMEQPSVDGYLLLDTDDENSRSWFVIGPDGIQGTPVALDALDRKATLLLIAVITVMAMLSLARRRRVRPDPQLDI